MNYSEEEITKKVEEMDDITKAFYAGLALKLINIEDRLSNLELRTEHISVLIYEIKGENNNESNN